MKYIKYILGGVSLFQLEAFYFGGEAFKGLIYGGRTLVTILQTINAAVNLVGLTMNDFANGKFFNVGERLKEYDDYVGKIAKIDWSAIYDGVENLDSVGEMYCTTDYCEIKTGS